jgi:hypothetical protein
MQVRMLLTGVMAGFQDAEFHKHMVRLFEEHGF